MVKRLRSPCALLTLAAVIALASFGDARAGGPISGEVPSYTDAPVLYHFFSDQFGDPVNLELVHKGKLKLGELGTYDIHGFDWSPENPREFTYWVMMENFWYLVPLMKSDEARDRTFVRYWLDGWLDTHNGVPWNNYGAIDAMSASFRVMTFVWYLRLLEERAERDSALVARINAAITEHQEFLRDHYAPVSNHGFWEAVGLFETTRAQPDSALALLALARLDEMIAVAVTDQGFYIERAPAYHFTVANWIRGYVQYFRALPGFRWGGLPRLEAAHRGIEGAGYHLCDHSGRVPQIGDTDAKTIDVGKKDDVAEVVVDERVGYAIFKEADSSRGRYVLFSIPGRKYADEMPFHNHDDALAVYYSHKGEIILGDQGKYTYVEGARRSYIKSAYAHSTIVEDQVWKIPRGTTGISSMREGEDIVFGAGFDHEDVRRLVRIPGDGRGIQVVDSIAHRGAHSILWQIGADVVSVDQLTEAEDKGDETVFVFELTTKAMTRFRLSIHTDAGPPETTDAVEVVAGQEKPMLGWYSPGAGELVPHPVIRLNVDVAGTARVVTRVEPR